MADLDRLVQALNTAEAHAGESAAYGDQMLALIERLTAQIAEVGGRRPPASVRRALADLDQARQYALAGKQRAAEAQDGIRTVADATAGTTTPAATTAQGRTGTGIIELSSSDPDHVRRLNKPPASTTIVVDGRFRYETDDQGRVVKAAATLETIDLEHPRSEHAQKTLSGKLPGDDAGHLFARIFKGPGQKINLAPMESLGVNRGEYGRLERLWREKIEAGEQVEVEVRLVYSDANDRRPTNFRVRHRHTVGGELGQVWKRVNIDNTPAER